MLLPAELDGPTVARLFVSMFQDSVSGALLSFMIDHHHDPYIQRLIEVIPDIPAGFKLGDDELETLRAIATFFPSAWMAIALPNEMITTHRSEEQNVVTDAIQEADRTAFWEKVVTGVRADFANVRLRGFLYDYLGIAELEDQTDFQVKSKTGPVGGPISIQTRNVVRRLSDELVGEAGTRHALIRLIPGFGEPGEEQHPEPVFELDDTGE